MILTYGEDDFLTSWEVLKECPRLFWRVLWKQPPLNLEALGNMQQEFSGMFRLAEVPTDLSFPIFWDAYAHKVGNKKRAEKLWNALDEGERAAALAALPRYASFLITRPTMEKAFAETWLSQRRWEV